LEQAHNATVGGIMTKASLASRVRRTALIGGLATAAFLSWAAPAAAGTGSAAVVATGGQALYVRSAPSTTAKVLGVQKDDRTVRLVCQVKGSKVKGTRRTTTMWNKLSTGGYISDAYVKRAKVPPPCNRPTVKTTTVGFSGKAPSAAAMHPLEITAKQTTFKPNAEQLRNAKAIVATAQKMNLPPRAWVIGIATSIQESTLHNYGHLGKRNDHDSLGLFQQRPSMGWGTPEQITKPEYAAGKFFAKLVKIKNWNQLPVTKAAQRVQISGFPNAYAKHETQAGLIIQALYGKGPYAA
jgi:hypothetical protein